MLSYEKSSELMFYRLYRPEDFPALYAIEEICFQPPFRFSRSTMRSLVSATTAATWIAEEQKQMAGFAIVHRAPEPDGPIAYIQTIEVAPTQRNRGIARELLKLLENSATTAGARAIWLHVAEANAPAIRLYESCGYLPQGREENFYATGIHAVIYLKALETKPLRARV